MAEPGEVVKVRIPKEGEILGEVIDIMGGSRVLVQCNDGKERLCRIPGKIRRFIWVREGDVVVVEPWDIDGDKKGDVKWRYTRLQADWLRKKGYYKG
ncbi:translation initiation factor eIF-1A [Candidatus Micrarchaeota archaeon]|nr:MAG: translation initiation factor eIF-1A [Candidatus Micrarchaeota archaeon]